MDIRELQAILRSGGVLTNSDAWTKAEELMPHFEKLIQQRAELLEALKNSQEAIRQLREFGSPHLLWDDIEFENKRAIQTCEAGK